MSRCVEGKRKRKGKAWPIRTGGEKKGEGRQRSIMNGRRGRIGEGGGSGLEKSRKEKKKETSFPPLLFFPQGGKQKNYLS